MKRIAALGVGSGIAGACIAGWYLVSPFAAVLACRTAIVNLNADNAIKCVDFPLLRENLKAELPALFVKQMQEDPEMANNPFASIGMAIAMPLITGMVDSYVTPSGLKMAFKMAKDNQAGATDGAAAAAYRSGQLSESLKKSTFGYEDLNKFQITGLDEKNEKIKLIFNRNGFSDWKLAEINFAQ